MVVRRGDVLVPLDRNPLEIFLLSWAVFVGIAGAAALLVGEPRSPAGHLGWWLDLAWYVLLGGGAILCLTGTFWRDVITGVLIVRAGMIPAGSGALIYSAALLANRQPRPAAIILGFGAACVWRAVQITQHVRAEMTKPTIAKEPPSAGGSP